MASVAASEAGTDNVIQIGEAVEPGTYVQQTDESTKKKKKQSPQDAIDEFWSKFNTTTPGLATTILPDNLYAKRAAARTPKGAVPGESAARSYDEAVASCKQHVAKIVRECRRVNQKYRDSHFDIERDLHFQTYDCLRALREDEWESDKYPRSVKRVGDIFENPKMFVDGASANDVRQGRDGDCWFLAALCTLSNVPNLIEKVCVTWDEAVGVYGFVFHRDGEWISTVIDDKLYLTKPDWDTPGFEKFVWTDVNRKDAEEAYKKAFQTGSGSLYFVQSRDENETWLPLLEKAYAKAHGDYSVIEGGFCGEALEDLTGGVTSEVLTTDVLDKEQLWQDILRVNQEFLFGCSHYNTVLGWGDYDREDGIVEGHAYSVMRAVEIDGQRLVCCRNPWGKKEWSGPWSDGSKEWTPEWMMKLDHTFGDDGQFWMSFKDFLSKFRLLHRTRLFGPEWTVTQQWTSLNVPWAVDFHSTKFRVKLECDSPVVLVLSQLDERYFDGLQGEYAFSLQFRLHKDDEDDYIVRSNATYHMDRSVSAELDLSAGEYTVLLKISATRPRRVPPPEQVIREVCREKRDKLLAVGLSYDLAHAKGVYKESDEDKKAREEYEAKQEAEAKEARRAQHKEAKATIKAARLKKRAKERKRKAKAAAKAAKKKATADAKEVQQEETILSETHLLREDDEQREAEAEAEKAEAEGKAKAEAEAEAETKTEAKTEAGAAADGTTAAEEESVAAHTPKEDEEDSDSDDDDSDSDSDSDSDLDSDYVPEAVEEVSIIVEEEEEEDEFQKDPWNAVCVVGLRVYSKESKVSVEVVRPLPWMAKEAVLDEDDTAKDATKDGEEGEWVDEEEGEEGEGEEEEETEE